MLCCIIFFLPRWAHHTPLLPTPKMGPMTLTCRWDCTHTPPELAFSITCVRPVSYHTWRSVASSVQCFNGFSSFPSSSSRCLVCATNCENISTIYRMVVNSLSLSPWSCCCILPVCTCAHACAPLKVAHVLRLNRFYKSCVRSLVGVSWTKQWARSEWTSR